MAAPLLAPLFVSLLTWIFREVIIKFVIFTAVFLLVLFFVPYVVNQVAPFASANVLSDGFGQIDSQVWFFLNYFALDYGMPLIVSAYVARFIIRRVPLIG
jgi:hypothetical protein